MDIKNNKYLFLDLCKNIDCNCYDLQTHDLDHSYYRFSIPLNCLHKIWFLAVVVYIL